MDVVSLQGPLTLIGIGDGVSGTCGGSTACQIADVGALSEEYKQCPRRAHTCCSGIVLRVVLRVGSRVTVTTQGQGCDNIRTRIRVTVTVRRTHGIAATTRGGI